MIASPHHFCPPRADVTAPHDRRDKIGKNHTRLTRYTIFKYNVYAIMLKHMVASLHHMTQAHYLVLRRHRRLSLLVLLMPPLRS